jgi:AcrR family transcriptional regulator
VSEVTAPAAGRRERKKQQLRERIVDEATELIFEQGLAATTIDQIVERVDISQTTFFNYFPNKTALIETLVTRLVDRWYSAVGDAHPAGAPVADKVRTLFHVTADLTPEQHRLVRDLIVETMRSRAWVASGLMRMVAHFRDELAAGQARGEVRDDQDAATLADCIVGLYVSVRLFWIDDAEYPIAERLESAGELAVEMLRPPPAAG